MPESEYTVYLLPGAYDKVNAHVLFLAQVSVTAADRLYEGLHKNIASLKYDPEMYPVYTSSKTTGIVLRHKLYTKRYRIVFEVIDSAVYVYDVQDCRQNTDKHLV